MFDFAIVGGGIVGLATALALGERYPGARLVVIEKEDGWARHQTGHNSGVIHSGIYYKPGSFKAQFCRAGNRSMVQFCQQHDIAHEVCGKVIVATEADEVPRLRDLHRRGLENGLAVTWLRSEEVCEIEPHVRSLAGLRVPDTGIVDYAQVARRYARLVQEQGGELRLGERVVAIARSGVGHVIETTGTTVQARTLINCAGLHSDRVARLAQADPQARIVPFRGEYYELTPERRHLVRTLIYPVPNPDFPFLGVHFTRMIDGNVHAGPNAVLSFKREGYRKTDFDARDLAEVLTYPGFWKLVRRHWSEGFAEIVRSHSNAAFVRSLQRLIPEVRLEDLVPAPAGVRAQAVQGDGKLVDDFLIVESKDALHVCNAPSPAATSSLEIGRAVAQKLVAPQRRATSV